MRRLRISAISFLNTAPLMWDFEQGKTPPAAGSVRLTDDFEISYTIPSQCAEALSQSSADIGIIPAVTYARIPKLVIIPDAVIAAKRAVRSILLVSKVPWEQIRTLAADTSSRTSVALAEILLRKIHGSKPEFIPMEPELGAMLERCDAALLIGDPALLVNRGQYLCYDLAEEWHRLTGKPFVFAFWAVRMDAVGEARRDLDLPTVFRSSRDHGMLPKNIAEITRNWAPFVGLSEEAVRTYLTENIHYTLDHENLEGMQLFFRYAAEYGIVEQEPDLRFLGLPLAVRRSQ